MILRAANVVLKDGVKKCDIRIADGRIAEISPAGKGKGSAESVLECQNLTVFPGLIDMHVHLREPGFEKKETIETGAMSAVKGGFTQVCCMPNTKPVIDNKIVVSYIKAREKEVNLCKIHPIGAITEGQKGENLAAIGGMKAAGAVAISEDGKTVVNTKLMANAMLYAADFGLKCLCHCEDASLVDGGVVHEGYYSTLTGLKGSVRAAEDIVIARELCLAESLGVPVHICHVSTYSGVQLIREAKARGVQVTAETCPHYFTLTDEIIKDFDTNTKVNPPIREERDRLAIIEGLKDGTLDCIVTDHAPHHADDKNVEYNFAAFGISGLETSFALSYTQLVKGGALTLEALAQKMSAAPAQILNLEGGEIKVGAPADLAIVDLNEEWVIDPNEFASKGKNTPFAGRKVYGKVKYTLVNGEIKYQN
ncbi:MAG: dihydroorotase [Clostridia bacterium]|nr:dihydroorotase [Clostridia bacterium]